MTQGDGVSTLKRRQLYFLQSGFDLWGKEKKANVWCSSCQRICTFVHAVLCL